ncbi:MAG: ATP-binding cassette domain-containing protein [Candidatus Lokiarchaeota archaeon]|nr:ATP-binding cassette domain-containing protein [Candidatus Lokiarchaeota archaeon]MBD3199339.1 ATP-binding cassette domain-containing protein [Candidatus Lokiarchaeota archaeon]
MIYRMNGKIPKIVLDSVNYTYPSGTKALLDVNLNINKSELVGIMGKNGAGKTTLIRTLNGLIRPSSGRIFINGRNINDQSIAQLSKKIGIIFQNPNHQLFSNTVYEEIEFSLKSIYNEKELVRKKIEETLTLFDFQRYRNRSPLNLSGGEKKKLALASIMCRDPEIIVFDEPTLGQDAKEIEFFINLLRKEQKLGKTIIIITHNVEFTIEFIPRTILMSNGKILADGPSKNILTNEKIIEQASLILPQVSQFKIALNKLGIKTPDNLYKEDDMIDFLSTYLGSK